MAPEADVSEQVRRLRRDLDATVEELRITPDHIKRLVDTALELDGEQPLMPCLDERFLAEGLYEVPALTKSWARATDGLLEKLEREGEQPKRRPITFDPATAKGLHDVVLAHLGHPLTDMSARLMRAAVWSGHTGLHRVTAVVSDGSALEDTLPAGTGSAPRHHRVCGPETWCLSSPWLRARVCRETAPRQASELTAGHRPLGGTSGAGHRRHGQHP